MARFYGAVDGGRGEVHRLGHATSGIRARANGWDSGVKIIGYVNSQDHDCFDVYATSGSNGSGHEVCLGTLIDGQWLPSETQIVYPPANA